jgi:hypothetical protein
LPPSVIICGLIPCSMSSTHRPTENVMECPETPRIRPETTSRATIPP